MISLQRLEANRRNALRSTGPTTEAGKQKSRLNAVRHGLTAETVVASLEDAEDYNAFEAAIIADYDVQTAVARELVLRLASLLWRLRRANAIEADLFEIHAKTRELRLSAHSPMQVPDTSNSHALRHTTNDEPEECEQASEDHFTREYKDSIRRLTQSFLRLSKLDGRSFERLNRYEAGLWRQTKQTLYVLHHRYR